MTIFSKAEISNDRVNIVKSTTVKQSHLSSECWLVQAWGLDHCITCEFLNTEDCGGKEIRITGRNEYGCTVPLE